MKKLTLFLLLFAVSLCAFAQTARVQIIHNSPTPTVDIYANDARLLDNFVFRTATPFIDVPAGVQINIGVALDNSVSAADAIANFPVTFEAGKTYVVVASGIVGGSPGFGLSVTDMGQETSDSPGNVGILFFHGSPDAPTVDILAGGAPIIDDASYGDFQGYLNVPATDYILDVTPGNDNSTIVASYKADLGFWGGNTAVILASGFLSGDDPAFEPWVALNNGGTFPLPAMSNANGNVAQNFTAGNTTSFSTMQLQPNPANDYLEVNFQLERASEEVFLLLVNQLGQRVQAVDLGSQLAGQSVNLWI